MEDRFNRQYKYPWVLLNEEPFTDDFKRQLIAVYRPTCLIPSFSRVTVLTDAPISFGLIPHDHWYQPDWIDENRAREGRTKMMWQGIIYAGEYLVPNVPSNRC